jgi:syntaxin-binding protein 5
VPFKDRQLSVRLIAVYQSGHAEIYTLAHSGNPVSWSIVGEPVSCKAVADPLPGGTFVVDTQGVAVGADRTRLAALFRGVLPTGTPQCLMITVGAKGARCNLNIDGDKVAKIEWGGKVGLVQSAQIVENLRQYPILVGPLRLFPGD